MHRTQIATDEGFKAARDGLKADANPYAGLNQTLAEYWLAGYRCAGVPLEFPILRRGQAPQVTA